MADHPGGRGPVLARLARPTGRSTTFAVVADPHVTATAAGTWKVLHRTEARFRTALTNADRLGVDAVVSTGDLTRDGTLAEFELVDTLIADLNAPFVAVPGNHDVPKTLDEHETPPVERFVERYSPGALPSVVRIGGVDLVALDSATVPNGSLADTHEGAISAAQVEWLDATLAEVESPIVVTHHPVGSIAEGVDALSPSSHYRLRNAERVVDVLAAHNAPLVVSGHVHWPAVVDAGSARQVIAPAACSFPQAALLVHVEPRGTTISLLPLAARQGLEEAYRHARRSGDRVAAFVGAADDGYFERFPLVDEATDATALRPRDPPVRPPRSS
jgi:Icc-related predicted phosphoesterase